MFDWLTALPQWFQIFFLSSMGILFWVIIGTMLKKGFSFAYGKFSLSSGKYEVINPHAKCQHVKDIFYLLMEQQNIILKKEEIKKNTLSRQMNYAEERFICILGDMQDIYIKLLQDLGEDHPTEVYGFKAYQVVLELLKVEILFKIRIVFRRNKLCEMSEEEFSRYSKDKTEMLITVIFDFITHKYFYIKNVSKEDLYKANSEYINEMKTHIFEIIMRARSVSIEHTKIVNEFDKELEELIVECIGTNHRFF